MNTSILQELNVILPEIILLFGAIFSLMFGSFFKTDITRRVICLSIVTTLIAIVTLYLDFYFYLEFSAFNQMIISNAFTSYSKFLVLGSVTIILCMLLHLYKFETFITFETPILILISAAGMILMISSNSLISLYLSLEMMSLPIYILAASNRSNSLSSEAGLKYFLLGSLASGIFLLGASMVYGFTATVNFTEIYEYFTNLNGGEESIAMPVGFLVGMVLILIAFAFKISAVPFHMWTPDVYQGSPTVITAFLASAPKVAGVTILIRILFEPFAELYDQWQQIIIFIAIASMLTGSLGAIKQTNFKRLLAYSTIGHIGFILSGLVTIEPDGVSAILIYLTIYITLTLSTFAILLILKRDNNFIEEISDFTGLFKTHPNIAFCLTVLLLSMAGIPPLAGFFIKFYILIPIFKAGLHALAVIFVLCSVIATYYYLKIIRIMYFSEDQSNLQLIKSSIINSIILFGTLISMFYILLPNPLMHLTKSVSLILFK